MEVVDLQAEFEDAHDERVALYEAYCLARTELSEVEDRLEANRDRLLDMKRVALVGYREFKLWRAWLLWEEDL